MSIERERAGEPQSYRYEFDHRPEGVELELDWLITNQCNFSCIYCYPQIKARIKSPAEFEKRPPGEVVEAINSLGKRTHAIISGGEPFMYPKFVDFAQLFTEKDHYLSIYTNFSTRNIYDFADRINPERVANLFPAFHSLERQNRDGHGSVEEYINKVVYCQNRGFNVHGIYVLHPTVVDRASEEVAMLKTAGVRSINLKIFKGVYEGAQYPEAYAEAVGEIFSETKSLYPHNEPYIEGKRNFQGKKCDAGRRFVKIEPNGDVFRCASIPERYGNIYSGDPIVLDSEPRPCTAKRVLTLTNCLSYLVDFNTSESFKSQDAETAVKINRQ